MEDVKATWRRFGFISGDTICMIFFMEDTKSRRQTFWNVILRLRSEEEFRDILDSIERFLYFESKARKEERGQRI